MTPMPLFRGRFRPVWTLAAVYLVVAALLRLVLWAGFGRAAGIFAPTLAAVVPLGAINDLVVLAALLFPLTVLLALAPQRLMAGRAGRHLFAGAAIGFLFGLLYLCCVEFFFFQEFDARFNLVAVDYLIYPHEVFINIWQAYPVARVLLGVGLLSLFLFGALRRHLAWRASPAAGRRERLRFAAVHLLAALVLLAAFSTDTLAVFDNRVANEITANGVSSLFRAFHTNELDYGAYYATMDSDRAFGLMQAALIGRAGTLAGEGSRDLNRCLAPRSGLGRLNVVVIVEESFGAQFVGAYGAGHPYEGLTPNFDRLATRGLLFSNAFASGTRTVRGLGAIIASLPPIPSEGIIKRPGSWPIANWGEVLARQGYRTSFLYGGLGLFDNMNPFFAGNGFALSDRRDIRQVTFSNIWGVCDQDLFNHALDYFDAENRRGQPFFSLIMTTSNHSPYTFPAGIAGVPPQGGDRPAGIRYADYALGEFLAKAAAHPWYGRTLFVVVADHDARVYGSPQVPLQHYRIPLLIMAPGRLAPQRVENPIGQMDIAPTVMGLLGLGYQAPFFGQDVLHQTAGHSHPLLVNHDHDVGLRLGDRLVVLGLHRSIRCYRIDTQDGLTPTRADADLVDLAVAYFQTAAELFQTHRYQLPPPGGSAVAMAAR